MSGLTHLLLLTMLMTLIGIYLVSLWEMSLTSQIYPQGIEEYDDNYDRVEPKLPLLNGNYLNKNVIPKLDNAIDIFEEKVSLSDLNEKGKFLMDAIERFGRIIEYESNKAMRKHSQTAIAVLVLACDRLTIKRCLQRLLSVRPSAEKFPIVVSQDCQSDEVSNIIKSYGDRVFYIRHQKEALSFTLNQRSDEGYSKIARHYVKALNKTFFDFDFKYVIIVEDDLYVSNDFFEYFMATLPIIEADPTLFCVSAWNDNGKVGLIEIDSPQLLHRTDFFPGLGWMLTKSVWSEFASRWPEKYWDDWIRRPEQRKERACIRPEISRTKHFGNFGVSGADTQFKELKKVWLNEKFVPFTKLNLSYLLKSNYDDQFQKSVLESQVISFNDLKSATIFSNGSMRALYCREKLFPKFAKSFGLMKDFRSKIARTAYRSVVSFFYKNARIYLIIVPDIKNLSAS